MAAGSGSAAPAVAAKDEMVLCYGYQCPLASQCKKGSKCTKTCTSEADAEWNVLNHLQTSPYHGLTEAEAKDALMGVSIQVWEEKAKTVEVKKVEEAKWEPMSQRSRRSPARRPRSPRRSRSRGRTHGGSRAMVPARRGRTP